jgi:hypothetical protein
MLWELFVMRVAIIVAVLLTATASPAGFSMLQVIAPPAGFLYGDSGSDFLLDDGAGKLVAE